MNTITTTTLPTIPIYLQKYIVKILCCYIDSVNRGFKNDESNEQLQQRIKEENDIRECIEHLSLVNHSFFQTICNNLTVSVDFISYHYNSNVKKKRSNVTLNKFNFENHYIVKRLNYGSKINGVNIILCNENIKELVLNCKDWCDTDENEFEQLILLVNQVINSRYKSLEKLIIRNDLNLKFIKFIDFNNIKLSNFIYTEKQEIKLPLNVKEISTVIAKRKYLDKPRYLEFFRSIKQIDTLLCGEQNIDFKFIFYNLIIDQTITNSTSTCFTNINRINVERISIENCYYMFKLMPKLLICGLNICIDDLIFELGGCNDSGVNGRGNSVSVKSCLCSLNFNNVHFKQYWKFIVGTIKDHKFLKMLVLVHKCPFSPMELDTESVSFMPKMFNDKLSFQLKNEFDSMISTNKSLISFHLGNIPKFRINDNILNKFKSN